jgi:putative amidoligase enzyme
MAALDYTFGVEIECYLPAGQDRAALAQAIETRCGVPCMAENYNHRTRGHWKLVTDNSLGDYARGCEAVSPILKGALGLQQLAAVLSTMEDFGCTVSKACGVHVHVGVTDWADLAFYKNLFTLYAQHEPVIDAFMPPSRRANAGALIKSITRVDLAALARTTSLQAILSLMDGGRRRMFTDPRDPVRYFKLNLLPPAVGGQTVEFRQHSGSLDKNKVNKWVMFCLKMVEAARAGKTLGVRPGGAAAMNTARVGSKAYLIGELALRPEGVTADEALAATGWTQISIPPNLRACGLAFTTVRSGRIVRYFAQAAAASTPTVASLNSLTELLNLDAEEAAYFADRTSQLRGNVAWAA